MHSFRFTASWRLKKMFCVHLERQRRMLDFWTVIALLAGKFQVSNESSQIHSASFFNFLDVTDCCTTNSKIRRLQIQKYKSAERAGHAVGPPGPTNCVRNTLFKNCRTASRKCGGAPSYMDHKWIHVLQQFWNDVSVEIVFNSPSETWWKEVGSQKCVCCSARLDTPGGQFEHFVWS
jgi:hypothetical protein